MSIGDSLKCFNIPKFIRKFFMFDSFVCYKIWRRISDEMRLPAERSLLQGQLHYWNCQERTWLSHVVHKCSHVEVWTYIGGDQNYTIDRIQQDSGNETGRKIIQMPDKRRIMGLAMLKLVLVKRSISGKCFLKRWQNLHPYKTSLLGLSANIFETRSHNNYVTECYI